MAQPERKATPVVVQVEAVEVKQPQQAPEVAQAQNDDEPTALKEKEVLAKPRTNVDLLDDDIFDSLESAEPDAEVVDTTSLLEDDDESDGEDAAEAGSGDETEAEEIGMFTIYAAKCLRCTHLVPELTDETNPKGKEFKGCHFENGNKECPAQYAQIVVGIPIDRIVKQIIEAEQSGDSETLGAIYARLAQKDQAQQAEVHRRLLEVRKSEEVALEE